MSGARRLDDDRLDELGQMREQGKTLSSLARHAERTWGVRITPNALSWQMLRIGADLPPERRPRSPRVGKMVVPRGNHVVRRFTDDDDRRLIELEAQGLGDAAIGRELGRKPNSIRGRLMTLARRAEREEEGR